MLKLFHTGDFKI